MAHHLGLRIDVDTYVGARKGLPFLLDSLAEAGFKASLFLPGGADRTGLAFVRILTQRGYLSKLLRTRALRVYGPTALATFLQPSRAIVTAHEEMHRLLADGHEVAAHGYEHTVWHNQMLRLPERIIDDHIRRSLEALEEHLGRPAVGFGGPGWQANETSLRLLDRYHLQYGSDARGECPFVPVLAGQELATPQVPTTLPSLDELLDGLPPSAGDEAALHAAIRDQRYPVYAAHAELEGRFYRAFFRRLLQFCADHDITIVPLSTVLADARAAGPLPRCTTAQGTVPGRPGQVLVQGETVA